MSLKERWKKLITFILASLVISIIVLGSVYFGWKLKEITLTFKKPKEAEIYTPDDNKEYLKEIEEDLIKKGKIKGKLEAQDAHHYTPDDEKIAKQEELEDFGEEKVGEKKV